MTSSNDPITGHSNGTNDATQSGTGKEQNVSEC
jgi:hypothetical protein